MNESEFSLHSSPDEEPELPSAHIPQAASHPALAATELGLRQPSEFTFQHNINMDLSVPTEGGELSLIKEKKEGRKHDKKSRRVYLQYNIKDDLRHMLHTTSMLESRNSRSGSRKSAVSHSKRPAKSSSPPAPLIQKPPKPQSLLNYQYPSLALRGLKILRKRVPQAHSSEPKKRRDEEEDKEKIASRPHSTDRVLAFSERFGQIVKNPQSRGSSRHNDKENTGHLENSIAVLPTLRPKLTPVSGESKAGLIIKQRPTSPPLSISDYKNTHLERLLEARGKAGIKDPLERFVWKILAGGRSAFEESAGRAQHSGIYASTMRELNNTLLKQRQSVQAFANETLFSPTLLHSLNKKIHTDRWLQLYLIKILCKKSLLPKIREIFTLEERLLAARREHRKLLKSFFKLQLTLRRKKPLAPAALKPFLCGSKAKNKPRTLLHREKTESEDQSQLNIQDLQLRQMMCRDKVEKLGLKLAFELIRLQYLLRRESDTYLNLVLNSEKKAISHLFFGGWLHYVKIKKEKCELIELARSKLSRVFLAAILRAWRSAKRVQEERKEIARDVVAKIVRVKAGFALKGLGRWRTMSQRGKLVETAVELLRVKTLAAKGVYSWRYTARYQRGMKEKAKSMLMKNKQPSDAATINIDRMALEKECKDGISAARNEVLIPAKAELQDKYRIRRESSSIVQSSPREEGKPRKNVHETFLRYKQIWGKPSEPIASLPPSQMKAPNTIYKRLEDRSAKSEQRLILRLDLETSPHPVAIKEHARTVLSALRGLRPLNIRGQRTFAAKRRLKCIAQWKSAYLVNALENDVAIFRGLLVWKGFIKQLHEDLLGEEERSRQALKEHEMKRAYQLFLRWRQHFLETKANRLRAVELFRKRRCLSSWKKYIFNKAGKLMKTIKAKNYCRKKTENAFFAVIKKAVSQKAAAATFYHTSTLKRGVKRWRIRVHHRNLLRNVFKLMAAATEEKRRTGRMALLQRRFNKWKRVVFDSPEARKERIKRLAAESHRSHSALKKCFHWIKARSRVRKGAAILAPLALERVLRPRFRKWISATEQYLSHVLARREKLVSSLLSRAFNGWKRETLLRKLTRLFRTKRLFAAWASATQAQYVGRPKELRRVFLQQKVFLGFRVRMKQRLERQRREIVGKDIQERHSEISKKMALVRLMEWIMRAKKKRIVMQTVAEFRGISLMRKGVIGLLGVKERKRQKAVNAKKAETHFAKVKENRERMREMLDNFSRTEYGITSNLSEEQVLTQKALRCWESYAKRKSTEKQIIRRFRQFHSRLQLTKLFLQWAEKTKLRCEPERDLIMS